MSKFGNFEVFAVEEHEYEDQFKVEGSISFVAAHSTLTHTGDKHKDMSSTPTTHRAVAVDSDGTRYMDYGNWWAEIEGPKRWYVRWQHKILEEKPCT